MNNRKLLGRISRSTLFAFMAACAAWAPLLSKGELIHCWTFNDGTGNDSVGTAHGIVVGSALIENGQLHIPGSGWFLTSAIGQVIMVKTLVAWTTLPDPGTSTKGSVLTLEDKAVQFCTFDGIVYGESVAGHWMAGSDNWNRTEYPQTYGFAETSTNEIMMAIVYNTDNSVIVYRNGVFYGSYTKGSLITYDANSLVQIGPRHTGNSDVYNGFVNEARIYSSALSPTQVADLYAAGPNTTVISPANGDFEAGTVGSAAPHWTLLPGLGPDVISITVDAANPYYPDPPHGAKMVNIEASAPSWGHTDYPILESEVLGLTALGEAYTFCATAVSTAEDISILVAAYRFSLWDVTAGEELAYVSGDITTQNTTNFVTFTTPAMDAARVGHALKVRLGADGHGYWPGFHHIRLAVDNVTVTTEASLPMESGVWTNPAGGSWPIGSNWSGNLSASGADAVANFSTLDITSNATVTLDAPCGVGHLVFGDMDASHDWCLTAALGGPLTLDVSSGSPSVTVSNQSATLALKLNGSKGLLKDGSGRLTLTDASRYAGLIAVKAGTLQLGGKLNKLAHRWSFNDGTARDSAGGAHGVLYGTAMITNGALRLSGSSGDNRMETAAFGSALGTDKTLVVWCTLDDAINDAGSSGGPLSVVNSNQTVMDAIVYGERTTKQWMNGSENWDRTPASNGGALESSASTDAIMLVIVYDSSAANKICLYRNGTLYAQHNEGALMSFADTAKVVIGPRHYKAGVPYGYMNGTINEARVYRAALSSREVAALYADGPDSVPQMLPADTMIAVDAGATLDLTGGEQMIATLSGAGVVSNGAITVTSTLTPGDAGQALGTLMVQGDLTLADAAVLNYDYNGAAADSVDVNGTLTIQGTNTVNLTAIGAPQPPRRVTLFTFGTLVGGADLSGWTIQGGGLSHHYQVDLETDATSIYLNIRWVGTIIFVR